MRRAIIEDAQSAGTDYNTIVNARKGGEWAPTPRSGLCSIGWEDLDAAAKSAKEKIAALDETIKSLDVPREFYRTHMKKCQVSHGEGVEVMQKKGMGQAI